MKYGMIAGMIIPLLLLKKSGKVLSALPSVRGVFETKHVIPGRIRMNVPRLVGNNAGAEHLEDSIKKLEPVNRVCTDTVTGSVVMEYKLNSVEPVMLIGAVVRVLGLDSEIESNRPSDVWKIFKLGTGAFDETLRNISYGKLDTKAAVQLILFSAIGYAILKKRMFTLPDPTILAWWAYNHISQ